MIALYWVLPLMRALARITGRQFSAIAMKLANLLAVETSNQEGLANASALDRAVVHRYHAARKDLELRAIRIIQSGRPSHDRSRDIETGAVDVLKANGVPLHSDLVAMILAARDPFFAAPTSLVREALKRSAYVVEVHSNVFSYKGSEPTAGDREGHVEP